MCNKNTKNLTDTLIFSSFKRVMISTSSRFLCCTDMLTLTVLLLEDEDFVALGVPKEWVEPLKALGITSVAKLQEVEKPGKLANDLNGYKKKKKLDLPGLSPEALREWLQDYRT